MKKNKLLPVIQEMSAHLPGVEIFPVSALDGEGTEELFEALLAELPEGPKLYPDDIISNEPERFFVSELIREAVFLSLEKELPYATAVIIDTYEEKEPKVVIHASILVEKKSQKPIIIGNKGAMIKHIGTKARLGIEEFLSKSVYLDLHVKIRKDWRSNDTFLREAGLLRR